MKRFFLLFFTLLISILGISQNFVMTWQHCYGGSDDDKVRSIIPYKDGYLFFGSTQSHDGDISNNSYDGAAWLVNIDTTGNIVSDRCYGGFDWALGMKIIKLDTNGFYYIGSSGTNNGSIDGYWLAKADSNFNIIWQDVLGGSYAEDPRGGCLAHDGGIIESGITGSPDGDIEEYYGNFDNWLVKMNSDGSKGWVKTYANMGAEEGGAIIPTSDGGYIMSCSGYNELPGNIYCEGHDDRLAEAWLIKMDVNGEVEWNQCYGGSHIDLFKDVIELEDGYIMTGFSESSDGDINNQHGIAGEYYDTWVVKTDIFGEIIWSYCYGGSKSESGLNILPNSDGSFTIVGLTKSFDGDVEGNTALSNRNVVWMIKINENGELLYQKPFSELEFAGFPRALRVSDYKYIIAFTKGTWGCNYTQSNPSQDDIYIFEIQDMDEFIPNQAQGGNSVCLGKEAESYYNTELVINTMETQWLLLPEEAGEITAIHDSVLITWNTNFQDTAWLQVRAINEYGESAYSAPKEIIVYPPLIIADIIGPDSLCSATNTQTIFSTQLTEESQEINWYLQPETAGTILNQQDTAIITWDPIFEGEVSLNTCILNKCDMEEYSSSKVVQVRNCLGISNQETKELKFYPNPATNQITFELPHINKQSQIQIKDIYGKVIATLKIKPNQSKLVWECGGFASGVYFYEGEISGEVYRGKVILN